MKLEPNKIKNIAIIAHVDHGKTTLVDKMLQQSGTFKQHEEIKDRVLDSDDLEKERGITILSKNTGFIWNDYRINIIDTPGHADFGGEVERILSMADSVLLLVDAVEGPMPQTTFVLKKALENFLEPIVVINKIDRDGARPDWVLDKTFDLFVDLNANEKQLDFPVIYASALNGWATKDYNTRTENLNDLFSMIIDNVESPEDRSSEPLQMQITALDFSNFLGIIGIGKLKKGVIKKNQLVSIIDKDEKVKQDKVSKIMIFQGLNQKEVNEAVCGDIIALSGLDNLKISDTICDPEHLNKMANLKIDEPTLSMIFQVNDSPFAGNDGKFVTSRVIKDRLYKELKTNVALKVESTDSADKFKVSGRGELHLSILIENMRREGFEIGVSSPDVIYKTINGEKCEPFEDLILDIEEQHQGVVIEKLGERKAQLINLTPFENNKLRLNFEIPTRGLIGFRSEFLTLTSGTGIINHTFKEYKSCVVNINRNRKNGALISMSQGKAVPYALFNLQERGKLIIPSNIEVYEGMIIGFNSRENDLTVNPLKTKQLTNFRSSGADEAIVLTPETKITLEKAIEMINEDELIEVTPKEIRLRKRYLKEHERKKDQRSKN
tara:strand:+ start:3003 stop:4829 length:1827 start_codon:yes stop_codon:yes gene_type:complete